LKNWGLRASVYLTVALLAWGAITLIHPIPEHKAGVVLSGDRVPSWVEKVDSLEAGETLSGLLSRGGLDHDEARAALGAAPAFDARRLRPGMKITLGSRVDSAPSEIVLHVAQDRLLRLTKTVSGWTGSEETLQWSVDTLVVHGRIVSNLYDAFDVEAGYLPRSVRSELAWSVADVFEYRLDMSRDLQPGDEFTVLVEREQIPTGAMRIGDVIGVEYASGESRVQAIRHSASRDGRTRYFDQHGKSMQALFLRAPLEFRRVSSVFGMRRHPILGVRRAHTGTDYAASSGTPVRSIGEGVVVRAGRLGGYGNAIDVRHPNGFVSRYAHLRAFAKGIRSGARVSIAQTIGYVGMTGLASGPHLHFEVLVRGRQQNPRTVLDSKTAAPLPANEREAFERTKSFVLAHLERGRSRLAAASP
jgi:murein DD-endopeptidase MepM/ murein hydrolase activator NlpD